LGDERLAHLDPEEGHATLRPGRLAHGQIDFLEGRSGADVAQNDRRGAVPAVLPVHLAGARLADAGAATLGPARLGLDLPVPRLQLDPVVERLLPRFSV